MLGYDWLRRNECVWNFAKKTLQMKSITFPLFSRPSGKFVDIEPDTQIVPVIMGIHSLRTPDADWVVEPTELQNRLYGARTMLSDSEQDPRGGIFVAYLSSRKKMITEGTLLGTAEMVSVIKRAEPNEVGEDTHLAKIIETLPTGLTEDQRQIAI